MVTPAEGIDSILECDLAGDFDLSAPDKLTSTIETRTAAFVEDIEGFLMAAHNGPTRSRSTARRSRPGARKPVSKQ